jgi:hypothetical protein
MCFCSFYVSLPGAISSGIERIEYSDTQAQMLPHRGGSCNIGSTIRELEFSADKKRQATAKRVGPRSI